MMYVVLILSFAFCLVSALVVTILIGWISRQLPNRIHTPLCVVVACLLLTPTWGPATIAVVPVTFGWLLVPTVLTGTWSDLAAWVMEYPRWHAIAFPTTAVMSYLIIRKVRSNTPLRSAV